MPHEIEQFEDGTAAFASSRLSAWHQLGTVMGHAMTAQEALDAARLSNWNVRLAGLTATEITPNGVEAVDLHDKVATVRTHPVTGRMDPLGVVGPGYTPYQIEEAAEFLNDLTQQANARIETAGSLRGGRTVFLTMKLPESLRIGGRDHFDLYIAAFNSHDGSGAFRLAVTPVRVVCANTAAAALSAARSSCTIRHTSNVRERVAAARDALGMTWSYLDEFEKAAERMLQEEMTLRELRSVVDSLWVPDPVPSQRMKRNEEARWDQISQLFSTAPTQKHIRGSRWAGYQAITEYVDHFQPSLGRTPEQKAIARAERAVSGGADITKRKAFALTAL